MSKPYATEFTADSYEQAIDVLGKQWDKKADDAVSLLNPEPAAAAEDFYGVYEKWPQKTSGMPKPYDEQILRA